MVSELSKSKDSESGECHTDVMQLGLLVPQLLPMGGKKKKKSQL